MRARRASRSRPTAAARFEALARAAARAREPVAYIVGEREFWSLPLAVDRARAHPAAGDRAAGRDGAAGVGAARARAMLDVGTGSGAIAVALARELPQARGRGERPLARTRSPSRARTLARPRGRASRSCAATCWRPFRARRFDLVVANPPYVRRRASSPALAPEVRDYEPRLALAGGADGLDVLRRAGRRRAPRVLAPGGWLVLRDRARARRRAVRGARSSATVATRTSWRRAAIAAGIERVLAARRRDGEGGRMDRIVVEGGRPLERRGRR